MSWRLQYFQKMTRSIDLPYSSFLKQNSHKICSISPRFCLQITLTCGADDRCGRDRSTVTVTKI